MFLIILTLKFFIIQVLKIFSKITLKYTCLTIIIESIYIKLSWNTFLIPIWFEISSKIQVIHILYNKILKF